jgi:hypothetical protein
MFKTRGSRPPTAPYSFAGPKEYAEKGLPLAWSTSGATFLLRKLTALRMTPALLVRTTCTQSFSQWFFCVEVRAGSTVPVSIKKSAREGAGIDQAPLCCYGAVTWSMQRRSLEVLYLRQICSRQGRRFLYFLSFRRDKKKGRRGAGRSARGLCSYPLKVGFIQNPGVPPSLKLWRGKRAPRGPEQPLCNP